MLSKEETTIILDAPEWRLVLASLVTTSKVWSHHKQGLGIVIGGRRRRR